MITYGQLLQGIQDALIKQAFIPAPQPQQSQGGGQPGGQDATGQTQGQPSQPDPQAQQQAAQQQHAQQEQEQKAKVMNQGMSANDLQPQEQPQDLKNTRVTMSVADLLDLHSNGKATQAHLKTESLKVRHQFEHQKMLREERRKQEEEQQKKQQEAMAQQQQQQGMMGGGIYGGGQMAQPPGQPGQPPSPQGQPQQQPQPGMM